MCPFSLLKYNHLFLLGHSYVFHTLGYNPISFILLFIGNSFGWFCVFLHSTIIFLLSIPLLHLLAPEDLPVTFYVIPALVLVSAISPRISGSLS